MALLQKAPPVLVRLVRLVYPLLPSLVHLRPVKQLEDSDLDLYAE